MICNWKCQVGELRPLFWELSDGQDLFSSVQMWEKREYTEGEVLSNNPSSPQN